MSDVFNIIERLLCTDKEDGFFNSSITRDRKDFIIAGAAILCAIHKMWSASRLRVADRGLREGILTELMTQYAGWYS